MIIVDGKMPENCKRCPYSHDMVCILSHNNVEIAYWGDEKDSSCPIKAEMPDDHGDLIDKQSLLRDIETIDSGDEYTILRAKWMVRTAPIVLGRSENERKAE